MPVLLANPEDRFSRVAAHLIQDKDRRLSHEPMCHKVCKSIYTHKRSGQVVESKRSKMAATRVKVPDFKSCCFICGKDKDVKGIRDMFLFLLLEYSPSNGTLFCGNDIESKMA